MFSDQFGILGLQETWITPDNLYGAILFYLVGYLCFKISPHLLKLFTRMPQCCFFPSYQSFILPETGVIS